MTFLADLIVVLLSGAMAAGLAVRLWAGTGPFAWGLRIATLWALWTGLGSAVLYLSHRLELSVPSSLLAAAACACIAWLWLGSSPECGETRRDLVQPSPRIRRLITGACVVTLAAVAFGLVLHLIHRPYGWYDASMTWNPRASLLAEHQGPWEDFMTSLVVLQLPDRPLLLPGSVAWGLRLTNPESTGIPLLFSCAFGLAILLILTSALGRARGKWIAACGMLCLLCQYQFVSNAADQLADVPAALFLILATAMILGAVSREGLLLQSRMLAAGCFLGAAIWTKPEGWLYLLAASLACPLVLGCRRQRACGMRAVLALGLGAAPWAALALLHSAETNSHNVVAGLSSGGLSKLFELDRHGTVLLAVFSSLFDWSLGLWGLLIGTTWLSARAAGRPAEESLRLAAWTLTIIGLGFYLVYVITPLDQEFHLRSSLDRLLCQLWPSVVLISLWQADGRLLGCSPATE